MKRSKKLSPKAIGVLVLVAFLLAGWAAFQKEAIKSMAYSLTGAETVKAEFGNRAKLIDDSLTYVHTVKLNGVIVGKVHNIEETDRGTMIATLLVDKGTRAKLGNAPSAEIRPTLVTDGVQNVLLYTGGDPGQPFTEDQIPLERTKLPVALDDVLKAISSRKAVEGVGTFITRTDDRLKLASTPVRALVGDAPQTLRPAGTVLTAFQGTQPDTDLTRTVVGLESFAEAVNRNNGQFASIVRDLNRTTAALSAGSPPLADSIRTGPETMRIARAGLADLRPALDKLRVTSEDFRPSARQLNKFLNEFGPVLHRSRPVFNDLRDVLDDARPTLHDLVPVMDKGTNALRDVQGVVFDRLNGPIKDELYSPLKMQDKEYKGAHSPYPLYADIGYLLSDASSVWQHYDANQAIARLEAGGGGQSAGGTKFPKSVEEYMEQFGLQRPIGPNPGAAPFPEAPYHTTEAPNIVPQGGRTSAPNIAPQGSRPPAAGNLGLPHSLMGGSR